MWKRVRCWRALARNYANESSLVAELAAVAQGAVKQVFGEAHGLPKVPPVVEEAVQVGRKPVYARASLYLGSDHRRGRWRCPFYRPPLPMCGRNMIATLRRPTRTMSPALVMRSRRISELSGAARDWCWHAVLGLGVLVWAILLEARMRGLLCVNVLLFGACGAGDLTRDNPNDRTNAACGNGAVDPGELCDDANAIDEDGSPRDCTLAFCGDGVVRRTLCLDSLALSPATMATPKAVMAVHRRVKMKPAVMAWWTRARPVMMVSWIMRIGAPSFASHPLRRWALVPRQKSAMTATPTIPTPAATIVPRRAAAMV